MSPDITTTYRYDNATIMFHWATATLVVLQWLGAQIIDDFPSGPLRVDARSVHITMGLIIAALVTARLVWRNTRGRRLPPADKGILNTAAKGTHWALYGLLIVMLVAGMFLTWSRGDSIFNLFSIPKLDPNSRAPRDFWEGIHATVGWLILGLAGVHASAALVHRYIFRDTVLARMLPRT